MKKLFAITLILMFILSGCGNRKERRVEQAAAAQRESVYAGNQMPVANADEQSWPTGKMYSVPEWIGITRYYGGGKNLDDYAERGSFSMSVIAPEESLLKYMETLEREGFTITEFGAGQFGREFAADRGFIRLEIIGRRIGNERGYQLDFELQEIGVWPRYSLPDCIIPIEGRMLVNDPVLYIPGQNLRDVFGVWADDTGYNYQFTYTGLSMIQAVMYMTDLAEKLTDGSYFNSSVLEYGGFGFIKGTQIWNDQKYYIYGEVIQQDRNTYTFLFGFADEDQGW